MRVSMKSIGVGLVAVILLNGCTMMRKERQMIMIRAGEGETRSDFSVERESAQHLSYKLIPVLGHAMLVLYPPFAICHKWEIRSKECLTYRRTDVDSGVREEREIWIQVGGYVFPIGLAETMKRHDAEIFKYVMGLIDVARCHAEQQICLEGEFTENELRWCDQVPSLAFDGLQQTVSLEASPENELKKCRRISCLEPEDAELARYSGWTQAGGHNADVVWWLAPTPYPLEAAGLDSSFYSVKARYVFTNLETGEKQIKTEERTYTAVTPPAPMGMVPPQAHFTVQIVRHFSDLKSGKGLGGVKETYHLKPEKVLGSGIIQPLLN